MKKSVVKSNLIDILDKNDFDTAKSLIQKDPKVLNLKHEFYPLESVMDNPEMFEYMVSKGADINQILDHPTDPTYLHKAISSGAKQISLFLIQHCDPSIMEETDKTLSHTPLQRARMLDSDLVDILHRYQQWESYDDNDEKMFIFDINDEQKCRKVFKLLLNRDPKVNCYLKQNFDRMSRIDRRKCFSILKDYLKYWSY